MRRGKSHKYARFEWLEERILLNNAPWASDDSFSTMHDTPMTVSAPGLLGNDSDMDADPLTANLVSGPSNGTLSGPIGDGSFTYTPNPSFAGTDSFTYIANDGLDDSNMATVTFTVMVGPLQQPPPDSETCGDGIDNNYDGQIDEGCGALPPPSPQPETCGDGIDNNYDGQIDEGCPPPPPSITPPSSGDDSFSVPQGSTLSVSAPGVLGNDGDLDGNQLTIGLIAGPAHGTLSGPNGDGSFSYTPDSGFVGDDNFTYQLYDGVLDSNIATVTITVTTTAPGFVVVTPWTSAIENAAVQAFATYTSTMDSGQVEHDAAIGQAEQQYQWDVFLAQTTHDDMLADLALTNNRTLVVARSVYESEMIAAQEAYNLALMAAQVVFNNSASDATENYASSVAAAQGLDSTTLNAADANYFANRALAQSALDAAVESYNFTLQDLSQQESLLWDDCRADPACTSPDVAALQNIETERGAASDALVAANQDYSLALSAADSSWESAKAQAVQALALLLTLPRPNSSMA
ncbi:MAG: tandem-95 repeat protein [Planctomycetes bacterium]|nr:tandem-95 repeat protein [Planctomycetota bacterium]